MKLDYNIKNKPKLLQAPNGISFINIAIPKSDVESLVKILNNDNITVEINKTKVKRSESANRYLWELIGKLSEVLTIPKGDLYIKTIKQYGVYESLIIKKEALDQAEAKWNQQNTSVLHQESLIDVTRTFESKGVVWVEINAHYGTSLYDSKQFSVLLEGLISDCKLANVETLPPAEVERLIKLMEG